jgi:hypothetical protein
MSESSWHPIARRLVAVGALLVLGGFFLPWCGVRAERKPDEPVGVARLGARP